MKRTFTTVAAAAAVWALVTLPATAQSSGSGTAGSGSSQQEGSSSGSGATDQQGSTHGGQTGTGQSGTSHAGTSGQSGAAQSGTAAGSGSQTSGAKTGTSGASAKGSSQDRTFIMEAAAGGMAEVELGRLASQKASRSEVKEFGQMMVDDHTKANEKLMKIATGKGLAAPHALKPQDKATEERLSKLSGEAFDRAYMQDMVKDHQKDVAAFRKQSTTASDSEVKQFASSTLPTLEHHLQRAQALAKTVGAASDTARGTSGSASTAGAASGKSTKGASGSKRTGHGSTTGTSGSGTTGGAAKPPR